MKRLLCAISIVMSSVGAYAQTTTAMVTSTHSTQAAKVTAVTDCHMHGATQYCMAGSTEYQVLLDVSQATQTTSALPSEYTGCHSHGSETWCMAGSNEVGIQLEGAETGETTSSSNSTTTTTEESTGENCHFHAGVEHCVAEGESESGESTSCERVDRDYNVPLRIGLLFVILVTSTIGVFGPILLTSFSRMKTSNIAFIFLKQFGTGVIFSTAFVHLFTHADLMFNSDCMGRLAFEGTTAAIVMAGIFFSFIVDYLGQRYIQAKAASKQDGSFMEGPVNTDVLSVYVLEAGIIFHSLLIGLTLIVSGDSFFITLFIVILFHQMFEGIALGSRIAALSSTPASRSAELPSLSPTPTLTGAHLTLTKKLLLASAFALVTPIGMAIGIGVLQRFNGNDKSTLIAIGTLDALSAGILIWVGLVEMLAHDWVHGEMARTGVFRTTVGMTGLVAGAIVMSVLGKWA